LTILVTGAGGFIGSHLVRKLSQRSVIAVRRLASEASKSSTEIAVDMSRPGWTGMLPSQIETVVHLAQSRFHRAFPEHAQDVMRVNVEATFELLDWARKSRVQRFVLASTGTVYPPRDGLANEDDRLSPASFYAASKIAAECICSPFSKFFDVTILRLFGVYGPNGRDSVINRLVERVLLQSPIELDGGLGLITTPTYIDDCLDAIQRTILLPTVGSAPRVMNICGDDEVSLREVCSVVADVTRIPLSIKANDKATTRLSGSNARAKQLLGWLPRHTLRDGLTTLIQASRADATHAP
jgi:UDP-glucose 4-epimerase